MNSMNSGTKLLAVFLCGAAVAGCNAVEDTDDQAVLPLPASSVVINGEVSGLSTTRPVVLRIVTTTPPSGNTSTPGNVTSTRTLSFRGTNVLRFGSVPKGSTYAITVDSSPYARSCTIENGAGTANADVNNVAVTCVPTDVPRYTISAQINSTLAANRPAGFAVTLTTEEGSETIMPAAGQTVVPFTLPIMYPGANPPTFDYTITATNTEGGTINTCSVSNGTGALGGGNANITNPVVNSCLWTVSANVSYSNTPACNASTTLPNLPCSPAIAAGSQLTIATGLKLALRRQSTAEVVAVTPDVAAPGTIPGTGGTLNFPGTYASNPSALYEVVVQTHPTGQFCIAATQPTGAAATPNISGGLVNFVNSRANVTVQIRCRNTPATANQIKGVFQLDRPAVNPSTGAAVVEPRIQVRNFLTFFTNGTFLFGTHPSAALSGVEHGFYNYNPAAGTLQFTIHTDTNGLTALTYDHGLSGRAGWVQSGSVSVRSGDVTAQNVVVTPGAVGVRGRMSMTFGIFTPPPVAPATTPAAYYVPTWTFTEPRHTLGQIQGAWVTADSRRVFVYDDVTYYAFHAGVNGAPNLQDQCLTILDASRPSGFYTRRGGGTGCMATAEARVPESSSEVSVGAVDVPDAAAASTSTNTTGPFIPGFIGRLPGTQSTQVTATSPVNYTVTPGNPDTLVIQNTLNAIPIDPPIEFMRHTTY